MSNRLNRTAAIGVLSAVALGTLAAGPAYAKSVKVAKQGTCSKSSHWKLKLGPDGSVIETQFEIDSNHVGQKWNVVIRDNGVVVFSGARKTIAPSGSFTLTRRIPNKSGVDHVVATTKYPATGETCVGRAAV